MSRKAILTLFGLASALASTLAAAQIDPYKPGERRAAVDDKAVVKPGEAKGFNPQPEPPGKVKNRVKPGEAAGFNPQPEPPGDAGQFAPAKAAGK